MNKQASDMEIMEMIRELSNHMDKRFDQVDKRFDQVWDELNSHRVWLERIDKTIDRIDNEMVTKNQFNSLVGILRRNKTISEFDAEHAINLSVL